MLTVSHEALLAVCLFMVFLNSDIVAMEMAPLLRLFGIHKRPMNKKSGLIRKLFVFCLTYVYTHKAGIAVAAVGLFTGAELLEDVLMEESKTREGLPRYRSRTKSGRRTSRKRIGTRLRGYSYRD